VLPAPAAPEPAGPRWWLTAVLVVSNLITGLAWWRMNEIADELLADYRTLVNEYRRVTLEFQVRFGKWDDNPHFKGQ
jgi:ferric-dicitrate binding protein FerR (iron transport regulator)